MLRIMAALVLLIPCAARAVTVTVTGEDKYAQESLAIAGTDRPDDFRHEVYGNEVAVTTDAIPAGKLTVEIDLAEIYLHQPGKRAMSIFNGEVMLAPRVAIFEESGGFAIALTKTYHIDHAGGPVKIRFVAIEGQAKFDALRLRDESGQILASISAMDAKVLPSPKAAIEPFRVLKPEELTFFNADHSPFGAYTSLVYGCRGRNRSWGGFAHAIGGVPTSGILVGTLDASGLHRFPMMPGTSTEIDPKKIRRSLGASTDTWSAPGITWTHFSPPWHLADFDRASLDEKKRFVLPATWMEFTVDNRLGTAPLTLLFGLPVPGEKKDFASGAYQGFAFGKTNFLAIPANTGELLDDQAAKALNPLLSGSLFLVTAAVGETKNLRVIVASYDDLPTAGSLVARYYYTSLFPSIDDVISFADRTFPEAKTRCETLNHQLDSSGQNVYRQFLAAHALHSYLYNTMLLTDPANKPVFCEQEGQYQFINTFDLTVDHAFYQLAMHPWTLRNVLDHFAARYSYRDRVCETKDGPDYDGGISFSHDMGRILTFSPAGHSKYEGSLMMTTEELQNWILCAGLYWKKTGDKAWLDQQSPMIHECLSSLVNRDESDPAQRHGIIGLVDRGTPKSEEITTYDSLDPALKQTRDNAYIGVKCWACYVALEAMFRELRDTPAADLAKAQAERAAATITSHWNKDERFIPAIFDGQNKSRIIPAVEGLVYPQQMGLNDAVSLDGPYGPMIRMLRAHLDSVLKPGVCLDVKSGGWKLSSTSTCTWQSKVYLSQYVAEKILHLQGDRINGKVDAVHASFQVIGSADQCWCDQLDSGNGHDRGSLHYPRGVTSALWWLCPGENQ
jgi:xylan 1,4-beta-xylosidase